MAAKSFYQQQYIAMYASCGAPSGQFANGQNGVPGVQTAQVWTWESIWTWHCGVWGIPVGDIPPEPQIPSPAVDNTIYDSPAGNAGI